MGGGGEENASRRSQAWALKADVKHSFVFMMRHILRVLARPTVFRKQEKKRRKKKKKPNMFLHLTWR